MRTIRIWNTLSGKKEKLPARGGQPLRLFVCGPTVYDRTHIGHVRTYILFDFFVKYLRTLGIMVQYIQNITDIDDKIIHQAQKEGTDPLLFSKKLMKSYFSDIKRFGVNGPITYAPATKFIPEIVKQVKHLIKKGAAYKIEGDGYYFDISKFPRYGQLSKRTVTAAEDAVSRIDNAIAKRNKGDFCLWKFSKSGEPVWDSPLGAGRPGWHIEDTAISEHFFGPQYDIHGGGLDLKFPHHEAEIAQQETASGKYPFVRIWMHAGMLTVRGEKMSKSLGNFITAKEFLSHHSAAAFRFLSFSHHYRSPLNYDEKLIQSAEETLEKIRLFLGKLQFIEEKEGAQKSHKKFSLLSYARTWDEALADDINTPQALATLFEAIHASNTHLWSLNNRSVRALRNFITSRLAILGIVLSIPTMPSRAKNHAAKRETLRRNQQFIQSDALRKQIEELGYSIEDTPLGYFLWPLKK